MEEIIKQSFELAHIKLFKNYSTLKNKTVHEEFDFEAANKDPNLGRIDPFSNSFDNSKYMEKFAVASKTPGPVYPLRIYRKNDNRKFFYTNEILTEDVVFNTRNKPLPHIKVRLVNAIHNLTQNSIDWFETRKDRQIKRHYNNPFATIHLYKYERWIKKDGDKITMKLFVSDKSRNVNCKYFIKNISSITITFNLKTGNFTVVSFERVRKTRKKGFYCNSFTSLQQALSGIYNASTKFSGSNENRVDYLKEFNNYDFQIAIRQSLGFDDGVLINDKKLVIPDLIARWMPKFAELKRIKLPNDGTRFLMYYYPTEKYLKKNDRKLLASVLDRLRIKSKITIKLLHIFPSLDLMGLARICYLFGKDFPKYIANIHPDFFDRHHDTEELYFKNVILDILERGDAFFDVSDYEKDNISKIINDYTSSHMSLVGKSHNLIDLLYDHLKMLIRIKEYYPEVRINARTYDTFHGEHTYFSSLERHIKKAFSIHRVYEKHIIDFIESPIEIKGVLYSNLEDPKYTDSKIYYPKLLTTTEEYFEEGQYMSHCVGGYIERDDSIIVSLRYEKERVTNEFDIKSRRCIQSQYFCNQPPPLHYVEALNTLYDRIKKIPMSIAPIAKDKVALVINGSEVKPLDVQGGEEIFGAADIMVPNRYAPAVWMEPGVYVRDAMNNLNRI